MQAYCFRRNKSFSFIFPRKSFDFTKLYIAAINNLQGTKSVMYIFDSIFFRHKVILENYYNFLTTFSERYYTGSFRK